MWLSNSTKSLYEIIDEMSPSHIEGWKGSVSRVRGTGNRLIDLILQAAETKDDALRIARAMDSIIVGLKDAVDTPVLIIQIVETASGVCTGLGHELQPSDYHSEVGWILFRASGGLQITGSCLPECRVSIPTTGGFLHSESGQRVFIPTLEYTLYDVYNYRSYFYLGLLDQPIEYQNPINAMSQSGVEFDDGDYPVLRDCHWQVLVGDDVDAWLSKKIMIPARRPEEAARRRYETLLDQLDERLAALPAPTLF